MLVLKFVTRLCGYIISGFPKSLNLGDGWGHCKLLTAHEPIKMQGQRKD